MNTLKIKYDQSPESPREWDNFGILAFKNENNSEDPIGDINEWLADKLGLNIDSLYKKFDSLNQLKDHLEQRFMSEFVASKVYKYEHSGVAYSTEPFSCRWDSGQVGYIYVTKKIAAENFGKKICTAAARDNAYGILRSEMETYSQWANGEVYGFIIEDEEGDQLDSCWGFYDKESIADHISLDYFDLDLEGLKELIEKTEIE